jgi:hypothetical protein
MFEFFDKKNTFASSDEKESDMIAEGSQNESHKKSELKNSRGFECAGDHLSRVGCYMRGTKNPEIKKALDENREELNEVFAELETASDLDIDNVMEIYGRMSSTPGVAIEIVDAFSKAIPSDIIEDRNFNKLVGWLQERLDSRRMEVVSSALVILVTLEGKEGAMNMIGGGSVDK